MLRQRADASGVVDGVDLLEDAFATRMAFAVRAGLLHPRPYLPSKYLSDERGDGLRSEMASLPERRSSRVEARVLEKSAREISRLTRPAEVVELGCASGTDSRPLLDALVGGGTLRRLALLDGDRRRLAAASAARSAAHPALSVRWLRCDLLEDFSVLGSARDRLVLLLGGMLGDLPPDRVPAFLAGVARTLEPGGSVLLGLDLMKDAGRLEAAYNDRPGVTARFNLNFLRVVNERLDGDFDPSCFEHVARYDPIHAAVEMKLRAVRPSRVRVPRAGLDLQFEPGQEIRTEVSCKYTRALLQARLRGTGLTIRRWFGDPDSLFADVLVGPARKPCPFPQRGTRVRPAPRVLRAVPKRFP